MNYRKYISLLAGGICAFSAYGFESTKVLPQGVRNIDFRNVGTNIKEYGNESGSRVNPAWKLNRDLKFSDIIKGYDGMKKSQFKAFLAAKNIDESDAAGRFSADLNGRMDVFAPVFAYGLSDKITLAMAVPFYSGSTDLEVGFIPGAGAANIVANLANPITNQMASAIEAAQKINDATGNLKDKLQDNGYSSIAPWEDSNLGDVQLVAKYLFMDGENLKSALQAGFVLPTGRVDDSDILQDLPFGDGQPDIIVGLSFDQPLGAGFVLNEFGKYTYQLASTKTVRAVTPDESIEVSNEKMNFKLGDKIDAGISLQLEKPNGFVAGFGGTYFSKYGDRYETDNKLVKNELEKNKNAESTFAEFKLGYSTLPLYQSGKFPVPFSLTMEYKKQFRAVNSIVTDFTQIDFNVFF